MRLLVAPALAILFLSVGSQVVPQTWYEDLGLNFASLPDDLLLLQQQTSRFKALTDKEKIIQERIKNEGEMLAGLSAGNITVAEGVRRLRAARSKVEFDALLFDLRREEQGDSNQEDVLLLELRRDAQGDSDQEVLCRHLLRAVAYRISEPRLRKEVIRRMKAEMAAYLASRDRYPV
jgi:hypothetical protein